MKQSLLIKDLELFCLCGIYPEERENKQRITLDIEIQKDFLNAAKNDEISQTIDYDEICQLCIELAQKQFQLIEALGLEILETIKKSFELDSIKVSVKKQARKDIKYVCFTLQWSCV